MTDWQTRSFWLNHQGYEPGEQLDGDETTDIVIVGGGFTGLWSAICLKDADPSIDVTVLGPSPTGPVVAGS